MRDGSLHRNLPENCGTAILSRDALAMVQYVHA